jgi:Outer membrane receptor for ferrienterochelin and colicins
MSGILFVNAQEQKGNSGEEVFSASKKTEKSVDAAASVTVIDSKTIENRPTTNVTQLLDNVVGLTLDKQGANRYNITLRDRPSVF